MISVFFSTSNILREKQIEMQFRGLIIYLLNYLWFLLLITRNKKKDRKKTRVCSGKSSCNVRALTYCDLHKIMRDDLLEVRITRKGIRKKFKNKKNRKRGFGSAESDHMTRGPAGGPDIRNLDYLVLV